MPYIFIWGAFTFQGLGITSITNGAIKKQWGTRKGGVSKNYPHKYASLTTEIMIGQCTRSYHDKSPDSACTSPSNEQGAMVAMDRYKKRPLMKPLTTNKRNKKIVRYQRATAIQLTNSTSPVPQQISTNNDRNNSVQIAYCILVGKEEYVISESKRFSNLLSPTGMLTDNIIEAFMLANFLQSPEDLFILPSKTTTDILVHGTHLVHIYTKRI